MTLLLALLHELVARAIELVTPPRPSSRKRLKGKALKDIGSAFVGAIERLPTPEKRKKMDPRTMLLHVACERSGRAWLDFSGCRCRSALPLCMALSRLGLWLPHGCGVLTQHRSIAVKLRACCSRAEVCFEQFCDLWYVAVFLYGARTWCVGSGICFYV